MTDPSELKLFGVVAFAATGFVIGLVGLIASVRRRPARPATIAVASAGLMGVGAGLAGCGYVAELGGPLLGLGILLLFFRLARSERAAALAAAVASRVQSPRWQWAVLAVGCPAIAAVLVPHVEPPVAKSPALEQPPPVDWLPPLKMMPSNSALTDESHDLTLWQADIPSGPEDGLKDAAARELSKQDLLGRAIQLAPPDRWSNCHGWVFTGGRYLIPDHVIDSIIEENGYRPVEQPAAGDLVIYRNERGEAIHSAVVWAIGNDGRALLESKWAWMGLFLHFADSSPYGRNWHYYHSARGDHVLRGERESHPVTAKRGQR
jgi:hypothetical protein